MTATAPQTAERTAYKVRAMSVEACSCNHGCNCQFGGFPNEGICEFILGYDVKEGRFGTVDLAGVRVAIAAKYPNAIHEGGGHVALFVDDAASDEQVQAIATILSGQAGGMPWEAIAGTIARLEGPIRKPVEITTDGKTGTVRVPGAIELETEPLRNPVTGDINEVRIQYPSGGFFWDDGNIMTTAAMRVNHGDLKMDWTKHYAAIAEVNWTNQA